MAGRGGFLVLQTVSLASPVCDLISLWLLMVPAAGAHRPIRDNPVRDLTIGDLLAAASSEEGTDRGEFGCKPAAWCAA